MSMRILNGVRLLLIGLVVLGVAGMHTIGHLSHGADGHGGGDIASSILVTGHSAGDHITGHGATGHSVAGHITGHSVAGHSAVRAGHSGHETHIGQRATVHDVGGGVFNPLDVCVAILVAGLVLWLGGLRRTVGAPAPLWSTVRCGPPPPTPLSLRLADLSVLRI